MNADLKKAQDNLRIRQVNLKEMKLYIKDDACPRTFDLTKLKRQSFSEPDKVNEHQLSDKNDQEIRFYEYSFYHALGIRLIDPSIPEGQEHDENVVCEIVAIFEAEYVSKASLTDAEIREFSEKNAAYHIWPYWRELVQTTCNRAGMSTPLDIPTYKI